MRHSRHGKPIVEVRSDECAPIIIHRACRALNKSGRTIQAKEVLDSNSIATASVYVEFNGFDDIEPTFDLEGCHEQNCGV